MANWDGLNRRRFPRVKYPCLIIIRKKDTKEKEVLLTHTENIGVGGICVILKKNLKMSSLVELELDLLDLGNHVNCSGRVVWNIQRKADVKKKPLFYDIGIEFCDLSDNEGGRLNDIVDKLVQGSK